MPRFRISGIDVSVNLNPATLARKVPPLARFRERLRRSGRDPADFDPAIEGRIVTMMKKVGDLYVVEMGQRIDDILVVRGQLTSSVNAVLRGDKGVTSANVKRAFDDLSRLMRELETPPAKFIKDLDEPAALRIVSESAPARPSEGIAPTPAPPKGLAPIITASLARLRRAKFKIFDAIKQSRRDDITAKVEAKGWSIGRDPGIKDMKSGSVLISVNDAPVI